ncbi:hypothetical protein BS47DRAFT_560153 [Hydnum rufescens UP504]|uniref:DNA topoisomerase n=1 Tax=Hydnum rufescens UP504 TaxID=1448309 RepID=A0A9P6AI57_9AGAM|nr:hypothetical protein BS47DRAFT_560153 [Hydnum rufescens UP504]
MPANRVLCVAEKPSIAKAITEILSGGQSTTRNGISKFNKNYDFIYPQTNSQYTVTSVSGHVMEHDFPDTHRKWHSCDPFSLFDAPIETRVKAESKPIERNLIQEARLADILMIWTDCDREGENIGNEIKIICRRAKRHIRVVRARFSAIIAAQIHRAAQHPVELDQAQSDAVEARTLLDLRLGAAFTRMQSLALQGRFGDLDGSLISYGPCQFPTLGFVVSRYEQVQAFVPEQFWYIYLTLTNQTQEGEAITEFRWKRNKLFEWGIVFALYELVLEDPIARVVSVNRKSTKKFKPYPLTTVELQKAASRILRLTPKKVLDIAEGLYQKGFLSYPRTETDQFDDDFDFKTLIDKQTADPAWGPFATSLLNNDGAFQKPRKGKKNDKAHPPIHPTAHAANLAGDDKKVYEFITRRFLGCCSKDAEGFQTTVEVVAGGEEFSATGLIVLERNYLEVYTYDKWVGHPIPEFEQGEEFMPTVCELREGTTTAPSLLTEADLVTLMDKNGIGTDATIAQHIQTIVDREYVMERLQGGTKYLVPSTLGIGLVEGYNKIGFDKSLSKPQLRRETERMMVQVCESVRTKHDMLETSLEQYREVFVRARNNFATVIQSVGNYIQGDRGNNDDNDIPGGGAPRGRGAGGGRGGAPGPATNASDDDGDEDNNGPPPPRARPPNGTVPAPAPALRRPPRPISPPQPPRPRSPPQQQQQRPQSPPPVHRAGATPDCRCGVPAATRTVTRESQNKGKQFWTCGYNDLDPYCSHVSVF